jgi:hypothetical protein
MREGGEWLVGALEMQMYFHVESLDTRDIDSQLLEEKMRYW